MIFFWKITENFLINTADRQNSSQNKDKNQFSISGKCAKKSVKIFVSSKIAVHRGKHTTSTKIKTHSIWKRRIEANIVWNQLNQHWKSAAWNNFHSFSLAMLAFVCYYFLFTLSNTTKLMHNPYIHIHSLNCKIKKNIVKKKEKLDLPWINVNLLFFALFIYFVRNFFCLLIQPFIY